MPEYRSAFPDGIPVPSETDARFTEEQLAHFCHDRAATQRLVSHIMQLGRQQPEQPTPERAALPEGRRNAT